MKYAVQIAYIEYVKEKAQDHFVVCPVCDKHLPVRKTLAARLFHKPVLHRRSAANVFGKNFNYCKSCGRWVCSGCFTICDEGDMCIDCAKKQHLSGKIVGHSGDGIPFDFSKDQGVT